MGPSFVIPAPDQAAAKSVQERLDRKTKPTGSLGRLEELCTSLAAMTGQLEPDFGRKTVLVAAGDHGIAAQGVSLYPSEVTYQMVLNFLSGGAAVNVLARGAGAKVLVVDAGVRGKAFPPHPFFLDRKVGQGTADFTAGPAMSARQAEDCLMAGFHTAQELQRDGLQLLATGDMGIGNTTASAAVAASILGLPVSQVTGRGTGVDAAGWQHKVDMIEKGLRLNQPDGRKGLDVLAKVGGFEIGFLAGAILGAAQKRVPVILDGFISGAAALIAASISPACKGYMLAGHQSVEIGHRHMLEHLGLRAFLNLDLRLGEGSGAVLCFPLVDAACGILREMATFESAQVSDKSTKPFTDLLS